jgi:pimeloyl-ACP methyl ester carboxylesterase
MKLSDGMIASQRMTIHGIDLEVLRGGHGDPIVLLHGMRSLTTASRFPTLLAAHGAVVAPSCPGFGTSPRPKDFDTVYDLVQLQRALLDGLPQESITLVGLSFGGWLAAEVAAQGHPRLSRLVLVDPVGIKIGDRETADILDVFNRSPAQVRRAAWHDPDRFAPDFDAMEDAEIVRFAREWESLCLYAWNPYMYNPRLPRWLGRIGVPSMVVWGESDGIVTPDYGRAFARLIPGARFTTIAGAGHHPEIERPEELAALIGSFVRG